MTMLVELKSSYSCFQLQWDIGDCLEQILNKDHINCFVIFATHDQMVHALTSIDAISRFIYESKSYIRCN